MVRPYNCPHAKRENRGLVKFMMCNAMMDHDKYTYNTIEECVTAVCPHGYYCVASGRWEVSQVAKTKCRILNAKDG